MKKKNHLSIGILLNIYLPPIIWAGLIFVLSAQTTLPSLATSPFDFIFKKAAHMFVYAILFLLISRALQKNQLSFMTTDSIWLWTFLFCLIYAGSDELHQSFVFGRFATFRDVGYDTLGALFSFLFKYRYI